MIIVQPGSRVHGYHATRYNSRVYDYHTARYQSTLLLCGQVAEYIITMQPGSCYVSLLCMIKLIFNSELSSVLQLRKKTGGRDNHLLGDAPSFIASNTPYIRYF